MSDKTYIGDAWLLIEIDMCEDISSATSIVLEVKKPDGSTAEWTPAIYGTNYLRYTASASDLAQAGEYKIQPKMTLGGKVGRGETVTRIVYNRFA